MPSLPLSRPGEPLPVRPATAHRLHVGSGKARLEGWINIDMQALPGVDVIADVTRGLDYAEVEAVYAEHFLEHLPLDAAIDFLRESHRVLATGAWIRLSTPNLDWVWSTHYRLDPDPDIKRLAALAINRAFHGWEHRFLWNREMLAEALLSCGFAEPRWCRWGESELPLFQGIERHEPYFDEAGLPHVLIVEAQKALPQPERLARFRELLVEGFLDHQHG
jgi:predicted SAM-dependent methyltransferase